jgi:hypothetical protein
VNIAWNLGDCDWYARLLVQCGECNSRVLSWAGWTDTVLETTEAVLSAGPLGKAENTSVDIVGSLSDVATVLSIVEPLVRVLSTVGIAMDILNAETVVWVDVARSASLILAKLELSELVAAALF